MKAKSIFSSILLTALTQSTYANSTCVEVYQNRVKNLDSCYFSNPVIMAGNLPTGITFWTTTSPITITPCIYYYLSYSKAVDLLKQGVRGDGLQIRKLSKKWNVPKEQISSQIQKFVNEPKNCNTLDLLTHSELEEYIQLEM